MHLSLTNRRATSRMLKRDFSDATGIDVSCRTVRRKLQQSGLRGCVAANKPLCTKTHRKKEARLVPSKKRLDCRRVGKGSLF